MRNDNGSNLTAKAIADWLAERTNNIDSWRQSEDSRWDTSTNGWNWALGTRSDFFRRMQPLIKNNTSVPPTRRLSSEQTTETRINFQSSWRTPPAWNSPLAHLSTGTEHTISNSPEWIPSLARLATGVLPSDVNISGWAQKVIVDTNSWVHAAVELDNTEQLPLGYQLNELFLILI